MKYSLGPILGHKRLIIVGDGGGVVDDREVLTGEGRWGRVGRI